MKFMSKNSNHSFKHFTVPHLLQNHRVFLDRSLLVLFTLFSIFSNLLLTWFFLISLGRIPVTSALSKFPYPGTQRKSILLNVFAWHFIQSSLRTHKLPVSSTGLNCWRTNTVFLIKVLKYCEAPEIIGKWLGWGGRKSMQLVSPRGMWLWRS